MPSLLHHLRSLYPTSKRRTLQRMVDEGRAEINGTTARLLSQTVSMTDNVRILPASAGTRRAASAVTRPTSLAIIFEDDDILVVDKPADLLTSTTARERRPTLLKEVESYLSQQPRARVGLIHRLDRDASGILVFSKNPDAYRSLKTQFFHHSVGRRYMALVDGVPSPSEGTIDTRLIERADGTVRTTSSARGSQRAITRYQTVARYKKPARTLLKIELLTGRKHQIRVHLAARGWPIVGDAVYGEDSRSGSNGKSKDSHSLSRPGSTRRPNRDKTGKIDKAADPSAPLCLKAIELELDHPRTGKRLHFELDVPVWTQPALPK